MSISPPSHDHVFGNDVPAEGERRTRWVVLLTLVMMVVEIAAGLAFGSMALLADGWHMGTHAMALGVALFAYAHARRHAHDPRYTFGTGKVAPLGGFASAVALGVVALMVLVESVMCLGQPVPIDFDEAIVVAVIGLVVNVVSAVLLSVGGAEGHSHGGHSHGGHAHGAHAHGEQGHDVLGRVHDRHEDHNLRGAYLHVLADALTSVFAIGALLAGRELGWLWMDPLMGVLGSLVIAKWSLGLMQRTSSVLLDAEVSLEQQAAIRRRLEEDDCCRVVDLHVWRVGQQHLGLIATVSSKHAHGPEHYKRRLAVFADLKHLTIEEHHGP